MRKTLKKLLFAAVVVALAIPPLPTSAGLSEAVSYTLSQPQDAWATIALVAAGQVPNVSHLSEVSGTLSTDYAKTILALAASGNNPSTFGSVDYVTKLETYFDGTQFGSIDLFNDDAWSILALASVGKSGLNSAVASKNFLLSKQQIDGGWGYGAGLGSDTNSTAAVVMALLSAGVSADNSVIVNALNYLQTAQNADGGFGYEVGQSSDSGSTAWVVSALNKAGQTSANWTNGGKSPIDFLESMQDSDGGFWWVEEGTSDWNNKAMTSHVMIALSGKAHPVGYFTVAQEEETQPEGSYRIRIEGSTSQICDTYAYGITAMDLLIDASDKCDFTYVVTETSFGPYVSAIGNDVSQGLDGWSYMINYEGASIGAADYNLQDGDSILWFFGDWDQKPTRLSATDSTVELGEGINFVGEYYDGSSWSRLSEGVLKINGVDYQLNQNGEVAVEFDEAGIYKAHVQKSGFIRSQKLTIDVGGAVSQGVELTVEVDQGEVGEVAGDAIALLVSPSALDFGTLKPGESSNKEVTLTNVGTVGLTVGSSASGDTVFTQGITIDGGSFNQYSTSLSIDSSKTAEVSLTIPFSYLGSGVKKGDLIFWATAQ